MLPSVRAHNDEDPAVCSRLGCSGTTFQTDLGEGPVFWFGGIGPEYLQFGQADNGPRLTTGSVVCTSCELEHGIYAKVEGGDRPTVNIGGGA